MLDYDQGPQVADLRTQLRRLIADNVPADYLGAFTDDPADLEVAQPFCRLLADEGLLCVAWPDRVRRPGRLGVGADRGPRGDVGPPRAPGRPVHGRQLGRAGDHAPRHRRAAAPAPPAHRRAARSSGARASASPTPAPTWRRCRRPPAATATAGASRGQKIWTSYATMAQWCFLLARTSRGEKKQQGITVFLVPMDAPGDRGAADPVHARPPPPQRGVPRRRVGHRGRRPRRGRRGLEGRAGGPRLRAGRHRPLRPGRAPAAVGAGGPGRRLGRAARRAAQPLGPHAGPRPPGPAARLPGHRHAADGPGAPRRRRRLPHRGHPARPGERGGADGHRRRARRPTATRRRASAGRSRTTTATRCRPRWRPAASRCSGSCWPEPCWRRREHRPEPRGRRVRRHRPARPRGRRRRRARPGRPRRAATARAAPPRSSTTSAPGTSTPGAAPTSSRPPPPCAAAPAGGRCPTPSPSGWRGPRDVDADALVVVAGDGPRAPSPHAVAGLALRWVAVDLGGRRSRATPQLDPAPVGKPGVDGAARPRAARRRAAPATSPSGSSCRAGRCSASSTAPSP